MRCPCSCSAIPHDLFPTLVAAAGASIPSSHAPRVEGIDLTPVLAGAEPPLRPLFWHMPHFWGIRGPGIEPYSAVRLGDHKLLWFHSTPVPGAEGAPPTNGGPRFELYDLGADLGETRDLAAEEPATVAALARVLGDWLVSTDAQLSLDGASGAVVAFGNGGGAALGR